MDNKSFGTRSSWFVWGTVALWIAFSAFMLWAKYLTITNKTDSLTSAVGVQRGNSQKAGNDPIISRCQAGGMAINRMAFQRDNGIPREEMRRRYRENEILDEKLWNMMVDMVYDHPESTPEAVEKSIISHC